MIELLNILYDKLDEVNMVKTFLDPEDNLEWDILDGYGSYFYFARVRVGENCEKIFESTQNFISEKNIKYIHVTESAVRTDSLVIFSMR